MIRLPWARRSSRPILEMPLLEDYGLNVVLRVRAAGKSIPVHRGRTEEAAGRSLRSRRSSLVNPGNPTAMSLSPETLARIVELVVGDEASRPDAADRRRLWHIREGLPKPAGCTAAQHDRGLLPFEIFRLCPGWRLGVIAVHKDNIFDTALADLPEASPKAAGHAVWHIVADLKIDPVHRPDRRRQPRRGA